MLTDPISSAPSTAFPEAQTGAAPSAKSGPAPQRGSNGASDGFGALDLVKIDPQTLVPARVANVPDQRGDALFKEHPLTDAYRAKDGLKLPVQFHVYCGDQRAIAGVANLEAAKKYLAGSGLVPVETDGGQALVAMLVNDYQDTSHGGYQNAAIIFMAAPERRVVPMKNAYSTMGPLLDPAVSLVFGPYPMSRGNRAPLDLGRDCLGVDKYMADVTVSDTGSGTHASIKSESGKQAIGIELKDASLWDQLSGMVSMIRAFGFVSTLKMALSGHKAIYHKMVGYHPSELSSALADSWTKSVPKAKAWGAADRLDLARGTPLSDLLIDIGFAPMLTSRDKRFMDVIEPQKR